MEPTSDGVTVSAVGYGGALLEPSPAGAASAAEVPDCAASDGAPESLSTAPDSNSSLGSMPLTAASSATLEPARAAIAESVSPGCTTYEPAFDAGPSVLDPVSSVLDPASSVLDEVSPRPASDPAVPRVCDGIINVLPAVSKASGDNPLAAASWSMVRPSLAATE